MRYDAGDEQRQLQSTIRRFLERSVPTTTVRLLGEKSPSGFERDWWRQACELGWTSLLVPEEHGGGSASGDGLADLVVVAEECGRAVAPGPLVPASVVAWTLGRAEPGAGTQSAAVLEGILAGEQIGAWVVGERDGTWLRCAPSITAVRRGGDLVLSGTARAVEAGADADWLLLAAALDGGVVHVLVPADTTGVTRARLGGLDLVRRFADLTLDAVTLPASAIVADSGSGTALLAQQARLAHLLQCASMAGAAARALELTLAYAADRWSFGRPLSSYQVLKHRFADMQLWTEASFAAVDGATRAVTDEAPDAPAQVHAAQLYVGQRAAAVLQDCIQIHGGIGVTWEHDLHLFLRRVTTDRQLLGTPADHAQALAGLIGL